MREEERVCVVLYKLMDGHPRYAVLRRTLNWEGWELVKGHLEGSPEETVRQEVAEETGIEETVAVDPVDCDAGWTYEDDGEEVSVTCHCFLVEVPADAYIDVDANPHDEHAKGHFLNYRDARDILTHDNQRDLLREAHSMLTDGE